VRAKLTQQRYELLDNEEGTRNGRDPEYLHRMRVATRRARAVLKAAHGTFEPGRAEVLVSELAWLGGVLGAVRDLDVVTARLMEESEALDRREREAIKPLFSQLAAERRKARGALRSALNGKRYEKLVADLGEAVDSMRGQNGNVDLRDRAEKQFRRLERSMRALGREPTDDEIHEVRKLGKRARYAVELAATSPTKAEARFVKRAKAFQDVTGEHQDAVVAEKRLRSLAADAHGAAALAAGRLVEREHERMQAARSELPCVWKRLEKAGKRTWS
jgi:CHAD domain-containing protein